MRKISLATFGSYTTEVLSKADRKVINPALFRAGFPTLGKCSTFAEYEAGINAQDWDTYVALFAPKPESTIVRKSCGHKFCVEGACKHPKVAA